MSISDENAGPQSGIDLRREKARRSPSKAYVRRRDELQRAAAHIMRRKGFEDMTLGDLALELGSDRASIYYYTASKEELLADMVLAALMENEVPFARNSQRDGSATDRLRACITMLMDRYDRHFPALYIWVHRDLNSDSGIKASDLDRIIDLSQREFEVVEGLVRDGVETGELVTTLPVGVVAQTIIGLVAWTYRWYEPGHALSPADLAEGLADIALAGLTKRIEN